MRRTKIIATIGPASDTDEAVDALIAAGVDIFRINFSHGDRATQQRMYERIRAAADRAGQLVAIMQDLAGPKIRTGQLNEGKSIIRVNNLLLGTSNISSLVLTKESAS